ncbi:Pleiotropic regulator 1 [Pseudoloma neurophilia]|uniref:Pleiotropic regulator 1 n=1 Tax=Pseudoloma neurophilia TaxID=146866 RepID=A0A0R0M5J4_9MICR|nr:Pleiotropic regulator 1 [Pseudoloma neurophilia]
MKYQYKTKLKIHNGKINNMVYNHNFSLLASCSTDSTIKIISIDKNQDNFIKEGKKQDNCIKEGKNKDNFIKEGKNQHNSEHKVLKTYKSHVLSVNDIKFSDIYPIIISCSDDKRVFCHDLVENKIVRSFFNNFSAVTCLDIKNNLIVTGNYNNLIIYDLRSSETIKNINIGKRINSVKFLDSNILIGSDSFFILSENDTVDGFKINQFPIIKIENNGILLNSRDRIISIDNKDNFYNLRYTEILSRKCDFTGGIKIQDKYFYTNKDTLFYSEYFDGKFYDPVYGDMVYGDMVYEDDHKNGKSLKEKIYDNNIYDNNIFDNKIYDNNIYDNKIYDNKIYDHNIDKHKICRLKDQIRGLLSDSDGQEIIVFGDYVHCFFRR